MIVDDEPLAIDVIESHLSKIPGLELIAKCSNALEAAQVLKTKTIDLIFLDIQMPEITGIDFLRSLENPPLVIFTTAYSEYAVEGFELDAIDYLLKPIAFERLNRAVQKAQEYYQLKQGGEVDHVEMEDQQIFVKANQKLVKINYDEIFYIEAFADYVKIYIPEKRIVTLQTMKKMENKLPIDRFCRIHRSFIVGLKHVSAYSSSEVEVKGVKLPIGKNYKEGFLDHMRSKNTL
jgi:DNA-binding LytR/AlgR family response regulator